MFRQWDSFIWHLRIVNICNDTFPNMGRYPLMLQLNNIILLTVEKIKTMENIKY